LAIVLAPTDATLGQYLIHAKNIDPQLRQTISVESGLNDGMVLPFLLIALSFSGMSDSGGDWQNSLWFTAKQLIIGPVAGLALGFFGGRLIERGNDTGMTAPPFRPIAILSVALLSYSLAEVLGGNGFISVYVAGFTLAASSKKTCHTFFEFVETEGKLFTLLVFLIFGASFVPLALYEFETNTLIYALLSLTVIRMLPAALALIGTGLKAKDKLLLAWFGPRGLPTLLFVLLVVERSDLSNRETILLVAVSTVLISIFAHGLSAKWVAK